VTPTRPRLLDLFCGEGGAGWGYHLAGFEITGVDLARRCADKYPGRFIRGDAVAFARAHAAEFDAVHASPPCKVATRLAGLHVEDLDSMLVPIPTHTDLIPATRAALVASGRPWVIENVVGAELNDPVVLCGSMFGLGAFLPEGDGGAGWYELRRHRLFESSAALYPPRPCSPHKRGDRVVGVYGHGGGIVRTDGSRRGNQATTEQAREALDMPWASREGVSQAIPPAYTEWLGVQLLDQVARVGVA
jgi:DNA (cytosine-5)-methyltransferase 1